MRTEYITDTVKYECFHLNDSLQVKWMTTQYCLIILLLQRTTLGEELLKAVFRHLNLIETSYFGLRYIDSENQTVSAIWFFKVILYVVLFYR